MNKLELKMNPLFSSAARYLKHGWACGWTRRGEKGIQHGERGVKSFTTDPDTLLSWLMEYEGNANLLGSPPPGTAIMDVDLYKLSGAERQKAEGLTKEFIKRTNASAVLSARGGVHLLVRDDPALNKATLRALFSCEGEVKRNMEGYVLLPGSVFEGKLYKEIKGHEMDGRPAPVLPAGVVKPHTASTVAKLEPMSDAPTITEAKEMLQCLDPDCGYEEWMRIGFALHAVFGTSMGFKLWDWWSKQSVLGMYEAEGDYSTEAKWRTIRPEGKDRIVQLGTLIRLAREGGYGKNSPIEDFGPSGGWFMENTVGSLLQADPPAQDWVLHDVVERGKTALLAGAGGTGKSMFLYRIGIMASLGLPHVLGLEHELFDPKRGDAEGRVFMLSAEEDRTDTSRRVHAVANSLALDKHERERLHDRFSVMGVAGMNCDVVNRRKGGLSAFAEKLVEEVMHPGDVSLLIMDPSVFFGGGADVGTQEVVEYMRVLTYVARTANVALLLSSHIRKGAELDKDGKLGADAVKGNTAFVDLARGAFMMASMTPDAAVLFGLDAKEHTDYVGVSMAKTNYTARMPDMIWMKRGLRGALIPPEVPLKKRTPNPQRVRDTAKMESAKTRGAAAIGAVLDHISVKPCVSNSSRALDIGISERSVINIIQRLLNEEKYIKVVKAATHHAPATYALTPAGVKGAGERK